MTGKWREPSRFHSGPNPDQPESPFLEGENVFQVTVRSARYPDRFMLGDLPATSLVGVVWLLFMTEILSSFLWLFDRRYKVVVARGSMTGGWRRRRWQIVGLEFFDSFEGAHQRTCAIVAGWENESFAAAPELDSAEIRAARLRS